MKFKTYKQELVTGLLTLKIDGVQAVYDGLEWKSRAGKPLYNLPSMPIGKYEVYFGDWETSVSRVRTHEGELIDRDHLYMIWPVPDERLVLRILDKEVFTQEIPEGIEGFVIHDISGVYYKVKTKETYDVRVTGWVEGTGRNVGRLGALETEMGRVSGFNDTERNLFTKEFICGKIIEVECMSLTPGGKFRHPRFIRIREDKI